MFVYIAYDVSISFVWYDLIMVLIWYDLHCCASFRIIICIISCHISRLSSLISSLISHKASSHKVTSHKATFSCMKSTWFRSVLIVSFHLCRFEKIEKFIFTSLFIQVQNPKNSWIPASPTCLPKSEPFCTLTPCPQPIPDYYTELDSPSMPESIGIRTLFLGACSAELEDPTVRNRHASERRSAISHIDWIEYNVPGLADVVRPRAICQWIGRDRAETVWCPTSTGS